MTDTRVAYDLLMDMWPTNTDCKTEVEYLRNFGRHWYEAARSPHQLDLTPPPEYLHMPDNVADVDDQDIEQVQEDIDKASKDLRSIMLAQCITAVASDKAAAELEAILSDIGLDDAKVDNVCIPFSSYLMDADLLASMLHGAKHIPQSCKERLLSYYMEKAMDTCLDTLGKQRRQDEARRLLAQHANLISRGTASAAVRTLSGNPTQTKARGRT